MPCLHLTSVKLLADKGNTSKQCLICHLTQHEVMQNPPGGTYMPHPRLVARPQRKLAMRRRLGRGVCSSSRALSYGPGSAIVRLLKCQLLCTLDRSHPCCTFCMSGPPLKFALSPPQKPQGTSWAGKPFYLAACRRGRVRALLEEAAAEGRWEGPVNGSSNGGGVGAWIALHATGSLVWAWRWTGGP